MYIKLFFGAVLGVLIGMATGWFAFESIGSGIAIGIPISVAICGVFVALGFEAQE